MKMRLLTHDMSKGESWEHKDKRTIEICPSCDNRGTEPKIVFSIQTPSGEWKDQFFFSFNTAKIIGNALIKQCKILEKEWNRGKLKDYAEIDLKEVEKGIKIEEILK